jgi:hypothetical protein
VDTRALALGPDRVYFGDEEGDALVVLPKGGTSSTPTRLARHAPTQGALSVDDRTATVAWIANPGDAVFRVGATGGSPTLIRDRGIFGNVVASEGDVFITEAHGDGGFLTRITGTTSARLATFEGMPRGLAVDANTAYVATSTRLIAAARTRGEVVELARGIGFGSPQVDETWVYATTIETAGRARGIIRAKKTGGFVESIATGVRDAPIVLHAGVLYWFDADRPALRSATMGDRPASVLVSEDPELEHIEALAVDDDSAYVAVGAREGARIVVIPLR